MVTAKPSLLLFNAVNTHVIEQGNKYKDILVVASILFLIRQYI